MSNLKKILLSLFILLNLMCMVRPHMPLDYKFFKEAYRPVDRYLDFFSIYQDWMMFSPDPADLDAYITAEVEFVDGTKDKYVFPRNPELSWIDKYKFGEKYRKIVEESIRRDDHNFLWPDTARFVLRKIKEKSFHKIPAKVHLYRHWNITPPMNKAFITHLSRKQSYERFKFYTYEVL